MRTADADILILAAADEGHWASRWAARLPTARRVEAQRIEARRIEARRSEAAGGDPADDGSAETLAEALAESLVAAVRAASRPVVIVAHDAGVLAVAAVGASLAGVAGAFLVAAPPAVPAPRPLPFPAVLVASRDDPGVPYEASERLARALGAELVDAGASGHLDESSGHGPWPEGLMRFAGFLKGLAPPAPRGADAAETGR